jgi:hypothetical protein
MKRFSGVTSFSRYPLVEIIFNKNHDGICFLWDPELWILTIQPFHSYTLAYPLKFLETSRLLFGQLVWRKIIFFQFFLLDEWTTYFTSFPWTPSTPNSDSVWARGEFLLKTSIKLIFHVFSKELLHIAMWLKLPKGWWAGFSKNSLFCP